MRVSFMMIDHVDAMRLRLVTAATNGAVVRPQVIYEHGGLWWIDIGRGTLLIRPPELSLAALPTVI
jgi:hypothetical protein